VCGIAGIWGDRDEEAVRQMLLRLGHRGRDGQGMLVQSDNSGVLGHRRLAIMDPAGGHQPIWTQEFTLAIVAY